MVYNLKRMDMMERLPQLLFLLHPEPAPIISHRALPNLYANTNTGSYSPLFLLHMLTYYAHTPGPQLAFSILIKLSWSSFHICSRNLLILWKDHITMYINVWCIYGVWDKNCICSQRELLHAGVFHSPLLIVHASFLLLETYFLFCHFQVYNIVIQYFYRLYSISSFYKTSAMYILCCP